MWIEVHSQRTGPQLVTFPFVPEEANQNKYMLEIIKHQNNKKHKNLTSLKAIMVDSGLVGC